MTNTTTNEVAKKRDSSSTLMPTTDTMRKKAEFVSKCFIYMLKLTRCLKCTKSSNKKANNEQPPPGARGSSV